MYARIGGTRDRASSRRAAHAHWGTLDGLRDRRGRGHRDFTACDVGRGATHADRHNAVALTRLCFDSSSAPHDSLLDSKDGRPSRQERALMLSQSSFSIRTGPRLGTSERPGRLRARQRASLASGFTMYAARASAT